MGFADFKYRNGSWDVVASGDDKRLFVSGPCDMAIEVDHDDVNHNTVELEVKQLIDILAKHWVSIESEEETEDENEEETE